MDPVGNPTTVLAFSTWVLVMLLKVQHSLQIPMLLDVDEDSDDPFYAIVQTVDDSPYDVSHLLRSTLHHFRMFTTFTYLEKGLGFWVKP